MGAQLNSLAIDRRGNHRWRFQAAAFLCGTTKTMNELRMQPIDQVDHGLSMEPKITLTGFRFDRLAAMHSCVAIAND